MKLSRLLFFLILFLAITLRFIDLGTIPPGVNRDEAAIGYNAYSLLLTQKDEYGRFFPVSFQSFGDWKLPIYIYETMVTVKLFGLTPLAVRIPSAIAGVISVVLTFFLIRKLFGNIPLALVTMLLATISPWSIHLSRVGSEANTSVCIILGGVLLFLYGVKKHKWLLILSFFLLALSFGTYASSYVFTPLLVVGLLFFYRKDLLWSKYGIVAIAIFVLASSFLWFQTIGANNVKISGTGIFGDPSIVNTQIDTPRNEHTNPNNIAVRLLHNKISFGAERFVQNYYNAFSPDFLFIRGGGNHSHNIMNFGNMYLIEAPFFFLGIILLLKRKKRQEEFLILWWLLVSPVAASITKDAPHTVRMFAIFPLPALFTAIGIIAFIGITQNAVKRNLKVFGEIRMVKKLLSASYENIVRYGIVGIIIFLFVVNVAVYIDRYFIHFPYQESQYWGILYEKLNDTLNQPEFKGKKVIMSGVEDSPYIYFLFYSHYDPRRYQKEAILYPMTSEGFVHVKQFDRFTFRGIDWNKDVDTTNLILVSKAESVPKKIIQQYRTKNILLPWGEAYFIIVQTN